MLKPVFLAILIGLLGVFCEKPFALNAEQHKWSRPSQEVQNVSQLISSQGVLRLELSC